MRCLIAATLMACAASAAPASSLATSAHEHPRSTQPSRDLLQLSRDIAIRGGGLSLSLPDCDINIQGVSTDIGDISVTLNTVGGQNVMSATFNLDPNFQFLTDWMEFHWVQAITQDDCPARYFGAVLPFPQVDPPCDGWDYMYLDGAARTMPNLAIPNFGWFIDCLPWYYNAVGEAANNNVGMNYDISDAPGKCPDAGRTTWTTWLVAKTDNTNSFCLIAGFEWSISTAGNTLVTKGAPNAGDATTVSNSLTNGSITGWTVGPKCNVDCKPVVWDCILTDRPNVQFSPGTWTRDGVPIGETFPGGIIPIPGKPVYDHTVLPEQPNDWHWSVILPCPDGTLAGIEYWFVGFNWFDQIGVPIVCPVVPLPGPLSVMADIGADHYTVMDRDGMLLHEGPWSAYPNDLPVELFEPTVSVRQNFINEPPPCPGDVNGDGFVDFDDLNQLLGSYNLDPTHPDYNPGADLDGDNDVDFADLNTLLDNYNSKCIDVPGS